VWADDVRALDEGVHPHVIRPAKGIHITVPHDKVRCDIAVVIPVLKDKRSIFVVPWDDRVYIGTTDTDYQGPLDHPTITKGDVAYLLDAANAFLNEPLTTDDILGTWAGLRPLVASASNERTADLSRRHQVTRSASGLVTVTGGKLTTYRRMASDTVDVVADELGLKAKSRTKKLPIHGTNGLSGLTDAGAAARFGVAPDVLDHLVGRYGSDARTVLAMIERDASLRQPLVPSLPYLRAEAVFAARYEMAHTIEDVMARRTRALLLARDETEAAADDAGALIGPELGWDATETRRQVAVFRDLVATERANASTDAGDDPADAAADALAGTTP
jgi:glycerol-3-phosphate dehydrogenase